MATISQPLHHPLSAPVCQAAPTATLPAPHPPSQTTARPAQQAAVHVNATASPEAATESSWTVEDPAAATATIRLHAAPPTQKTTPPEARAEMESWYDDEEPIFLEGKGGSEEEKHTSRSFVAAVYLFAHLISRANEAGFLGARPTRSRIRGPAVTMFMLWLRDFVVLTSVPHVL